MLIIPGWILLKFFFVKQLYTPLKIIITGDLNLLCECWNWQVGGNEHAFVSLLNDFFLEQVNITPTRGNSILDLVITSIPERVKVREVLNQ